MDEELVLQRDGLNVIAAVRLASERGALVLRTMVVAEGSQRRGSGARLLQRASRAIGDRECLPPHLRACLGEGLVGLRREAQR